MNVNRLQICLEIYKMTNDLNPDFMEEVSYEKKKPSQHLPAQIY